MKRELQKRIIPSVVKVRGEGDGQPKQIYGYAALFNSPSQDLGGFVEVLKPGCFAKSLKEDDQRAFWNHNYDCLLGRVSSGTLRLSEDDKGLLFEVDVDDTTDGLDTWKRVRRGDVDGVSFGFFALDDKWSEDGKQNNVIEAGLIEISPVVYPAYLATKVEARSILDGGKFSEDRLSRRPAQKFPRLERARRIIRLDDEA